MPISGSRQGGFWIGAQTYNEPSKLTWHKLSDLAANDWEDSRDDEGENPTVPAIDYASLITEAPDLGLTDVGAALLEASGF